MRSILFKLIFIILVSIQCTLTLRSKRTNKYKSVVMFHGLGDTAYGSINSLIKMTKKELNESIYITSVEMGKGARLDFLGSYFNNINDKIAEICKKLESDEQLKDGFSLIGFSQGGQFSRAIAQRCNVKVLNLITLGAQHQGIYGLPRCKSEEHYICEITDRLFNIGFYKPSIQHNFVPAQYWHSLNYTDYIKHSEFLAEINNENVVNPIYKKRLTALKKFVMVKFTGDTIVDPIESEQFGFFSYDDFPRIIKLEESNLYKEDRLGLKELDNSARLIRISLPGDHLQISRDWFKNEIINKYIKNEINY